MSTLELKNKLIEKIFLIEDKSFLEALKTIIESKISSDAYELSDYQRERIKLGREQLLNGKLTTNDKVHSKIEKWLNSK